jgi:hypothetical protein
MLISGEAYESPSGDRAKKRAAGVRFKNAYLL